MTRVKKMLNGKLKYEQGSAHLIRINSNLVNYVRKEYLALTQQAVVMQSSEKAKRIVDAMYNNDPFSIWLGIKRIKDEPGNSVLEMTVRKEMLNGFSIAHGGITYALADSALAFAANSHGRKSVSVETSISHVQPVFEGDVLTTRVEEISNSNKIGIYHITILNQKDVEVAHFKGTVYRRSEEWDV